MLHDLCDAPADAAFAGETLAVDVSCIDTSRSIEVPQLPTGQIRFTAERAGRQLSFRRCLSTGTELAAMNYSYANVGSTSAMNGRWMELRSPLAPGRYIALIRAVRANQAQLDQPLDYAGTATLQLSSVASPGPTCPNARITLADDLWWLSLETIDAVDGGVVELTPESPRLLAGVFAHGVRSISRCADCAAAAAGTCAPIQLGVQGFEQLTETTSFSIQGGADAGLSLVFDVP